MCYVSHLYICKEISTIRLATLLLLNMSSPYNCKTTQVTRASVAEIKTWMKTRHVSSCYKVHRLRIRIPRERSTQRPVHSCFPYMMFSVLKLTIVGMKLSFIITARICFQSVALSSSNRHMDSNASFTTAGGFAIDRISTRCCRLIPFTATLVMFQYK